jgi:hypothetical protein
MRTDENGMRPLLQWGDVSGRITSCSVSESAIKTDPMKIYSYRSELKVGDYDDFVPFLN